MTIEVMVFYSVSLIKFRRKLQNPLQTTECEVYYSPNPTMMLKPDIIYVTSYITSFRKEIIENNYVYFPFFSIPLSFFLSLYSPLLPYL